MKKEDKKPEKHYFDVKIETMVPATITYRIFAENAEEALKLVKGKSPTSVKHKMNGRKDLKVMIYMAGTSIIKFVKQLTSNV